MYGPLALLLYYRLMELKIVTGMSKNDPDFFNPVLKFFGEQLNNIDRPSKSEKAVANLRAMIRVTPSCSELRCGIKYLEKNEHIVYKLVLDILFMYHCNSRCAILRNNANLETCTKQLQSLLQLNVLFYKTLSSKQVLLMNSLISENIESASLLH